ncbi:MAG: hypothetical protein ACW98D_20915 [Promethearchaeota archaeon]|jgi:hypothetical protein
MSQVFNKSIYYKAFYYPNFTVQRKKLSTAKTTNITKHNLKGKKPTLKPVSREITAKVNKQIVDAV